MKILEKNSNGQNKFKFFLKKRHELSEVNSAKTKIDIFIAQMMEMIKLYSKINLRTIVELES